jgi:hypothetical protein
MKHAYLLESVSYQTSEAQAAVTETQGTETPVQPQKQQTSQRLRDRFEDWRHSGKVELPDLSEFYLD